MLGAAIGPGVGLADVNGYLAHYTYSQFHYQMPETLPVGANVVLYAYEVSSEILIFY